MLHLMLSAVAISGLLSSVPSHGVSAQAKAPAPRGAKAAPTTAVVNINTASAAELDSLPGIGAKTAARIIEYRQKNGPFKKIEELMNVRGVGEKNFLKLKDQISVGNTKADQDQPQQR